ncbi:hypothetical protein ABNN70_12620 [Sporolactobacillus sp. Y61]|uniref:Uncharacterized protein n=1 Tax=Sporolactobacillus sp. Y61 TaxID=3160863 RepID=A0AAU8IER5_9BACL
MEKNFVIQLRETRIEGYAASGQCGTGRNDSQLPQTAAKAN